MPNHIDYHRGVIHGLYSSYGAKDFARELCRFYGFLDIYEEILREGNSAQDGGDGSGNFGHAGRPGKVGGSAPANAGTTAKPQGQIKGLAKSGKNEHNISVSNSISLSAYPQKYENPNITSDGILNTLGSYTSDEGKTYTPEQIRTKIKEVETLKKNVKESVALYRLSGKGKKAVYTPEREALHDRIINNLFKNAKASVSPVFIMLGGRGGSGKSSFKGEVYDDNFIVLDSDEIKKQLPEYQGWNASQFHEESSDILEAALKYAADNKINVVLDATMNGLNSAKRRLKLFKKGGYRTEGHYMFLPRAEAAKRAICRFLDKERRYVPIEAIFAMTDNEKNFDALKDEFDAWSFSDNNVPRGQKPKLVQKKGELYLKGGGLKWMQKKN